MGWSIGYDSTWDRDIGYGVPATCDHPRCTAEIDRGLAFVCGNSAYGGDHGCGLFFCDAHRSGMYALCPRCAKGKPPYERPSSDVWSWVNHKLTDPSWAAWRAENKKAVKRMKLLQWRRARS